MKSTETINMELMNRPEIYDGKATPISAVEFRFLFPRGVVCPCSKRRTIFTTNCSFKAHRKGSTHNKWLSLLTSDEDSSKLLENSLQEVRLLNIKNTELSNQVSQLTLKLKKACLENDILKDLLKDLSKDMRSNCYYDLD